MMRASQRSNLILGVILCTIGYISNFRYQGTNVGPDVRVESARAFLFQLMVFLPGNICLFSFIERRLERIDRILIPDKIAWPLVIWNALFSALSLLSNLP